MWIARNAPRPTYTAWPKLSMPAWPSIMLYERQTMISVPICDRIVIDRLDLNTSGDTIITRMNAIHRIQRPGSSGA